MKPDNAASRALCLHKTIIDSLSCSLSCSCSNICLEQDKDKEQEQEILTMKEQHSFTQHKDDEWLQVLGANDPDLQKRLSDAVNQKVSAKEYTRDDVAYVSKVELPACKGTLNVDKVQLEKLRRLCQLWDVELRPAKISSHRKVIGPIIVAFKRLMFPILRVFMKDVLRQQKDFNGAVIAMLAEANTNKNAEKSRPDQ